MSTPSMVQDNGGFLTQVASYYGGQPHLEDYCFLFPNRRSSQFFARELQRRIPNTRLLPKMTSLTEWLHELTHSVPVAPIEAVFILYRAYAELLGDSAGSMDHFVFWANIIISDFDEIDANGIDARGLYTNLSQLHEIGTDYLSPEVKEAVKSLFGIDTFQTKESDRLWLHIRDNETDVKKQFITLWESLAELYDNYHRRLAERGLVANGQMMLQGVKVLEELSPESLPWAKVVFVGFASLSRCEIKMMKRLKTMGKADFWWDDASPYLHDSNSPAGELIAKLRKDFGQPVALNRVDKRPHIEQVKVATPVGQVKCAAQMVEQHVHGKSDDQATRTAIVLPDKNLLIPLVNSLSTSQMSVNITMGYELRQSNITTLMRLVARAHRHSNLNKGTGVWTYYREDVKDILSHPIIKAVFPRDAVALVNNINHQRIFNVDAAMLQKTAFGLLFEPLEDVNNCDDVLAYIDRLAKFATKLASTNVMPHDETDRTMSLQTAFLSQYVQQLELLKTNIKRYELPLTQDGIFYLIDRLTSDRTVAFTGEPLRGMQVMGMLETRALDFDNLIILSCNDKDFPGVYRINSFIPYNLRRAVGLKTAEDYEAEMAYYFYRLIGHAHHVSLVYSSSKVSEGSIEPSRFIKQLALVYHDKVHEIEYTSSIDVYKPIEMSVPKGRDLRQVFVENHRYLSASSINEFIDCGLRFYLHQIEHLNNDNQEGDFMDAATYGTIIHDTLQELYYPNNAQRNVTRSMIEKFEHDELDSVLTRNINRVYRHADDVAPLDGDAFMLFETMRTYVTRVLDYDKQSLKDDNEFIAVLECEVTHKLTMELGGDVRFAFTYKADRIDRLPDGTVRIIDYKTGNDPTKAGRIDELFDAKRAKRPHAILQLMLYCNAYQKEHPEVDKIKPMIYKMRNMEETGVRFGKEQYEFSVSDTLNVEFLVKLRETIAKLLSIDMPFTQSPSDSKSKTCDYCRFTDFCRR